MAAHVISGARVAHRSDDEIEREIAEIEVSGEEDRKALLEFIEKHESVYSDWLIEPEFFLDQLERTFRASSCNVFNELAVFRLNGLDCFIDVTNRKWTWKKILLLAPKVLAITGFGAASIVVYCFVKESLFFGLFENVLFSGGVSDIAYVITTTLSRKNITWADYSRQRIRSATGKSDPIETIVNSFKLCAKCITQNNRLEIKVNDGHIWKPRGIASRMLCGHC